MTQQFDATLHTYLTRIEEDLERRSRQFPEEPQQKLFDAMRYSLLAGGKRLRPIMVLEFCRM